MHSETPPAEMSAPFRRVAEVLTEAMREARIPGAALGIASDGRQEHATFGVASLASLRPVTAGTRFQIASISKTYTATAAWRLIADALGCGGAATRDAMRDIPNRQSPDAVGWPYTAAK